MIFNRHANKTAAAVKPKIKPIQKPYGPIGSTIQSVNPKIRPKLNPIIQYEKKVIYKEKRFFSSKIFIIQRYLFIVTITLKHTTLVQN